MWSCKDIPIQTALHKLISFTNNKDSFLTAAFVYLYCCCIYVSMLYIPIVHGRKLSGIFRPQSGANRNHESKINRSCQFFDTHTMHRFRPVFPTKRYIVLDEKKTHSSFRTACKRWLYLKIFFFFRKQWFQYRPPYDKTSIRMCTVQLHSGGLWWNIGYCTFSQRQNFYSYRSRKAAFLWSVYNRFRVYFAYFVRLCD